MSLRSIFLALGALIPYHSHASNVGVEIDRLSAEAYGVDFTAVADRFASDHEIVIDPTETLWMYTDEDKNYVDFSSFDGHSVRVGMGGPNQPRNVGGPDMAKEY